MYMTDALMPDIRKSGTAPVSYEGSSEGTSHLKGKKKRKIQ